MFARHTSPRTGTGPATVRRAFQSNRCKFAEALERRTLLSAAGDLDPSFSGDGKLVVPDVHGYIRALDAVAVQPDGKLVVAGGAGFYANGGGDVMIARYHPNGSPDTTFGGGSPDGRVVTALPGSQSAVALAIRPDGKIVVAAYNLGTGGSSSGPLILRYNVNGTLDTTFGGGDGIHELAVPATGTASPADMKLAGGNKIVLAINTPGSVSAARLNEDGSPDTSFGGGDGFATADVRFNESVHRLAIGPDGSIFLGGSSSPTGSSPTLTFESSLVKFTPAGNVDTSFGTGGAVHATLNAPGGDFSLGTDLAFTPDGKLLFSGPTNGHFAVAKLSPTTGALDGTFSGDGKLFVPVTGGGNTYMAVQGDGRVVVTQSQTNRTPVMRADFDMWVYRFESDGDADPTWAGGRAAVVDFYRGWDHADDVLVQPDGKVVLVGTMESASKADGETGFQNTAIARLTPGGQLDATFSGDGKFGQDFADVRQTVAAVAVQGDGKTIVAGTYRHASAVSPTGITDDFFLRRYTVDGSLDATFGNGGTVIRDVFVAQFDTLSDILIQPDGKILALGHTAGFGREGDIALMRFNSNGTPDTSFSGDGRLAQGLGGADRGVELALRSDGDILVSATSTAPGRAFALIRYNANGTLDAGLDGDGILYHNFGDRIAVQADNKVLIVRDEPTDDFFGSAAIVTRLNTNGTLDGTYGSGGRTAPVMFGNEDFVTARQIVVQGGKALVLADVKPDSYGGHNYSTVSLIRFNANGTPDATFGGGDGKEYFIPWGGALSDDPRDFALDAQSRIVVAADSRYNTDPDRGFDFTLLRFLPDGQRDLSFGDQGRVATELGTPGPFDPSTERTVDVAIAPGGKIVQVGHVGVETPGYGVTRHLGDGDDPGGGIDFEIVGGVLRVNGSAAADNIVLDDLGPTSRQYVVRVNGRSVTLDRSRFTRVEVLGQGGDDVIAAAEHAGATYVDLPLLLNGGAGNDRLSGGSGNDRLLGMDGNDQLFGNAGDDTVDGGLGTDLQDGGAGADTVDYSFRNSAVFVDLDGDADDGASGERDTVAANVEHILGGRGSDTLTGNAAPNFIRGNGGNDTIRGGGGNDTLVGDGGQDRLFGDAGDDFLDARDGITDLVLDGGTGFDKARKDASDPRTSIEQLV